MMLIQRLKMFTINKAEAVIVRLIFKMYDVGFSYEDIIENLNQHGYKTKKNRDFTKASLHSLLRNTKYVGTFTYNRSEAKKSDGSRNYSASKPDEEILRIDGVIPALVKQDVWDRVQTRLKGNNQIGSQARHNYLLTGIIKCSCGNKLSGNSYQESNGTRGKAYRCHNKECKNGQIKAEWVDSFVLSELDRIIFNEYQIPILLEKMREMQKVMDGDAVDYVKGIKHQIEGIKTKISNVVNALADGFNDDSVREKLNTLREEEQLLQKQLLEKEAEKVSRQVEITENTIYDLFARYKEFIRTKDIPACRNFIKTYVAQVTVSNFALS